MALVGNRDNPDALGQGRGKLWPSCDPEFDPDPCSGSLASVSRSSPAGASAPYPLGWSPPPGTECCFRWWPVKTAAISPGLPDRGASTQGVVTPARQEPRSQAEDSEASQDVAMA